MPRDLVRIKPLRSSFLSFEKDVETIVRKLFVENRPYSDELKRLLCVSATDALEGDYKQEIDKISLAKLMDEYVYIVPKLKQEEFQEEKSVIIISFDNFSTNQSNPQFRDCLVHFDILCNFKNWDLGNYRIRPLKIAGYIDSVLDGERLSGLGTFQFVNCNELILDDNIGGYSMLFSAIHFTEDEVPKQEVV